MFHCPTRGTKPSLLLQDAPKQYDTMLATCIMKAHALVFWEFSCHHKLMGISYNRVLYPK